MSKYTCSISKLIDNGFDFQLNEYPIFDDQYRDTLNKSILDYYFMYEIGFETPALFRHYLKNKMELIMPKYNALYVAQQQIITNPLGNVDLTETIGRNVSTNGNSQSTSESKGKNLFQDTPSGKLKSTDIDDQVYATNLTLDKNNITDQTQTNGNTVESYTKHIIGSNGKKYNVEIYQKLVANFNSINQQIIDELDDLFMGVL